MATAPTSPKFSLSGADLKKVLSGLWLAAAAGAVAYLTQNVEALGDLVGRDSMLYGVVIAVVPLALNTLNKFLRGTAK